MERVFYEYAAVAMTLDSQSRIEGVTGCIDLIYAWCEGHYVFPVIPENFHTMVFTIRLDFQVTPLHRLVLEAFVWMMVSLNLRLNSFQQNM